MSVPAIIVEDEPLSRAFLKNLLAEFCPQINVIATASSENEATELIVSLKPALVFMDIELQQGTGFAVLQRTRHMEYYIVFTTALDYSGIRSLRFSGVPYIQKPIDFESLQTIINEMECGNTTGKGKIAKEHLLHTLDHSNRPAYLLVFTADGPQYVQLDDIIYLQASNNDTVFHLKEDTITAKGLQIKELEKLLDDISFFRPHPDFIIQLNKVAATLSSEAASVRLLNEVVIPVSPKKESELKQKLLTNQA
ncbi:MAG: response regulator transcription factor [Chitinophagaceae bacterium]|nr:MAG: response regulator transcription factor [Chitinophagaceae bacterium]